MIGDIDILINKNDIEKSINLLSNIGYKITQLYFLKISTCLDLSKRIEFAIEHILSTTL